jgi:hypothetical protein
MLKKIPRNQPENNNQHTDKKHEHGNFVDSVHHFNVNVGGT